MDIDIAVCISPIAYRRSSGHEGWPEVSWRAKWVRTRNGSRVDVVEAAASLLKALCMYRHSSAPLAPHPACFFCGSATCADRRLPWAQAVSVGAGRFRSHAGVGCLGAEGGCLSPPATQQRQHNTRANRVAHGVAEEGEHTRETIWKTYWSRQEGAPLIRNMLAQRLVACACGSGLYVLPHTTRAAATGSWRPCFRRGGGEPVRASRHGAFARVLRFLKDFRGSAASITHAHDGSSVCVCAGARAHGRVSRGHSFPAAVNGYGVSQEATAPASRELSRNPPILSRGGDGSSVLKVGQGAFLVLGWFHRAKGSLNA